MAFLRANADMFARTVLDMSSVSREVIEHHLAMCPNACPVKQKIRLKVGIIREVLHTEWIANPVVVPTRIITDNGS